MRPSTLLIACLVAPFSGPCPAAAASVASRVLIDPAGEHTGDEFGRSVASIGDVNGDGYDDVLVGAFRYPEIASVGQAYLYFGGPATDAVPDLVITPPAGGAGWFGVSVASAGDFNGDGYPDFIIGAQQAGNEGKAFIYFGGPSLDGVPDVTLTGETTGSITAFGASVASAGDVNGDGFDDVIVGAPWYPGGNKPGRAYVFFGGPAADTVPDRVFTGAAFYDQLGSVVGSAGDMNGDGHPDLFASAPNSNAAALGAGAIYVWFGGPGFDTAPDLTVYGAAAHENLMNAAGAGDVNADGFSDLIGAGRTQVRVWFGGSSPNPVPDLTLTASYASVARAGDVNGDGIDDFVVGAPNDGGAGAGRVSVYFGGSEVDGVEDLFYVGTPSTGAIGTSVAGGAHVDGPGPSDVITGVYWDPEFMGYNKGRVRVLANSLDICPGQADGTACSDGNVCTGGELCGGGVCGGGTPVGPQAIGGSVRLAKGVSGTTIAWTDPPGPYNVYRGARSGGSLWAYNQTLHDPHVVASSVTDVESPASGAMFFYLVSRIDACGESTP